MYIALSTLYVSLINHVGILLQLQSSKFKAQSSKQSQTNMSAGDVARKVVADVSADDLDQWVRSSTLTNELEEVSQIVE